MTSPAPLNARTVSANLAVAREKNTPNITTRSENEVLCLNQVKKRDAREDIEDGHVNRVARRAIAVRFATGAGLVHAEAGKIGILVDFEEHGRTFDLPLGSGGHVGAEFVGGKLREDERFGDERKIEM